ncbi:MAG: glycosyltransferase family 2 protein [Planctomycetota bacterium]
MERSAGDSVQGSGGTPILEVSVVAPAHNEEGNVVALADEIGDALSGAGVAFEFVLVDDGSTDRTREVAIEAARSRPWMRVISMRDTPTGSGNGQSAAFHAGFRACRGAWVASLDADLQNDPADLPRLLVERDRTGADFVQGDRSAARREGDAWIRQVTSVIGRKFRKWILGDSIRDTGCSLRVMRREIALKLPLEFKGMHRFIPVTARRLGYTVVELPVNHRTRHAGETKYGAGISKRAIPGLMDALAARWMFKRRRGVLASDLTAEAGRSGPDDSGAEISVKSLADERVGSGEGGGR